jgi:hypothetical protein
MDKSDLPHFTAVRASNPRPSWGFEGNRHRRQRWILSLGAPRVPIFFPPHSLIAARGRQGNGSLLAGSSMVQNGRTGCGIDVQSSSRVAMPLILRTDFARNLARMHRADCFQRSAGNPGTEAASHLRRSYSTAPSRAHSRAASPPTRYTIPGHTRQIFGRAVPSCLTAFREPLNRTPTT